MTATTSSATARTWAHFYVLGGLEPGFADPQVRDGLVALILGGDLHTTRHLSPQARAEAAAAFLRGWAVHRPQRLLVSDPRPVWHRQLGDTAFYVGIG